MQTACAAVPATPISFIPRTDLPHRPAAAACPALCSTCHLRQLCVPAGLPEADVQRLDGLLFARRRVRAGQPLFRQGDAFQFFYAVRSGSFKSTATLRDGREHVCGFPLPGEVLGIDGMAQDRHPTAATALEDSEVCAIPYAHLHQLGAESRAIQGIATGLLGRELVRDQLLVTLLGTMNAEERLAAFLLNVSQRMKARGWSPVEFHLRMSRAEIGSYLGMTLETVSRTFSAFQQQGLLRVDKKHLRLLDPQALQRVLERRFQ